MVFVRVSETYDLSTQVNKMGVIGVHTPSVAKITQVWGKAFQSHQRFRFASCDVTIACASMLPADPLQVGVESGQIAPQDMFNPILYRAVSNDSFNRIESRIYMGNPITALDDNVNGPLSLTKSEVATDAFAVYYSLLADPDGWRKAMPQSGLEMRGLYPIVYQMVNTFGNTFQTNGNIESEHLAPLNDDSSVGAVGSDGATAVVERLAYTFRGPSMKMPSIPTSVVTYSEGYGTEFVSNGVPTVPPTYVACIITPPAKLNKLYYRMKVTWTIELIGLRSDLEDASMGNLAIAGRSLYGTDYAEQSSKMDKIESSVDVKDADLELIMTAAR